MMTASDDGLKKKEKEKEKKREISSALEKGVLTYQ